MQAMTNHPVPEGYICRRCGGPRPPQEDVTCRHCGNTSWFKPALGPSPLFDPRPRPRRTVYEILGIHWVTGWAIVRIAIVFACLFWFLVESGLGLEFAKGLRWIIH